MSENDHKFIKTEFAEKWKNLTEKIVQPYVYFKSIDDYSNLLITYKKKISSLN